MTEEIQLYELEMAYRWKSDTIAYYALVDASSINNAMKIAEEESGWGWMPRDIALRAELSTIVSE